MHHPGHNVQPVLGYPFDTLDPIETDSARWKAIARDIPHEEVDVSLGCSIVLQAEVFFMNQNFAATTLGGTGQVGSAAPLPPYLTVFR